MANFIDFKPVKGKWYVSKAYKVDRKSGQNEEVDPGMLAENTALSTRILAGPLETRTEALFIAKKQKCGCSVWNIGQLESYDVEGD